LRKIRGKNGFCKFSTRQAREFAISGPSLNLFDLLLKDGHLEGMAARIAYCTGSIKPGKSFPGTGEMCALYGD
jgi:hypothetical protein